MITRIEQEFYERLPHQLERIADSLEKLADSKSPKTEVSVDVPVNDAHPIDSEFDVLAVTKVEVYPFKDGYSGMGHMKGLASIILNNQIIVHGLRIMEDETGLFVLYPNNPSYKVEELRSVVCPITPQLREHIENCVLEKYQDATK